MEWNQESGSSSSGGFRDQVVGDRVGPPIDGTRITTRRGASVRDGARGRDFIRRLSRRGARFS